MTALSTVCPDTPAPPQASAYSRFVQRIRRRYAQQMPLLPAGAPLRAGMQTALDALLASGLETGAALRVLRQLVLERLVALDCDGKQAPTLPTACGSLPPEGAGLAWGGPALRSLAPTLPTACGSLPP
ncbi:MAG: glutamine-synthetase adenylyltransferase, partial [Polaromonas sp.]|nr:glutamine-synthetase adenylyltransferase [Polaromonas sp.]